MTGTLSKYADGDVIFRQGDAPGDMYVIREGSVTVSRSDDGTETMLATLGKGDFFGEMSLFDGKTRVATVKAVGDVMVEAIGKEQLMEQVGDPVVWNMLVKLSGRIRAVDESLEKMTVGDASRRDALSSISIRRNLYY
jgi:CRP/FNR family cyclic AMP-dependent transcriptional regulator